MAFKIIGKEYCPFLDADRYAFVLDSDADVDNLPDCCAGSVAMVAAEGGKVYMVNASGEWVVV